MLQFVYYFRKLDFEFTHVKALSFTTILFISDNTIWRILSVLSGSYYPSKTIDWKSDTAVV